MRNLFLTPKTNAGSSAMILAALIVVIAGVYVLSDNRLELTPASLSDCQRLFANPAALKSELDTLLVSCSQAVEKTPDPDHRMEEMHGRRK